MAEASQCFPEDHVPFKAKMVTPLSNVLNAVVPLSPPVLPCIMSGTGESDLLGEFTYVDYHLAKYGADGQLNAVTDGVGVMTATNGDAIFLTWSGLIRPTPMGITSEDVFIITGGRGRFLGASGSGVINTEADFVERKVTCFCWEGTVSAPRE